MAAGTSGDGLLRWLLGGLVAGLVVLLLLIAAYAIGYDRGQEKTGAPKPPAATTSTETTTETGAADLVAQGEKLWTADGCAGCHSLDGTTSVGPTMKGLTGSSVTLVDGSTVTADDAYLAESITDPDAQVVKGYPAGVMTGAVAAFDLASRPDDVDALVAYIEAQK